MIIIEAFETEQRTEYVVDEKTVISELLTHGIEVNEAVSHLLKLDIAINTLSCGNEEVMDKIIQGTKKIAKNTVVMVKKLLAIIVSILEKIKNFAINTGESLLKLIKLKKTTYDLFESYKEGKEPKIEAKNAKEAYAKFCAYNGSPVTSSDSLVKYYEVLKNITEVKIEKVEDINSILVNFVENIIEKGKVENKELEEADKKFRFAVNEILESANLLKGNKAIIRIGTDFKAVELVENGKLNLLKPLAIKVSKTDFTIKDVDLDKIEKILKEIDNKNGEVAKKLVDLGNKAKLVTKLKKLDADKAEIEKDVQKAVIKASKLLSEFAMLLINLAMSAKDAVTSTDIAALPFVVMGKKEEGK